MRFLAALVLGAFPAICASIHLIPGSGLAGNSAALAAFTRAADSWASVLQDPVTIQIEADLANLGSNSIVGQSSSVFLSTGYANVRQHLMQDSADEPDDAIVAGLPTAAQFSANLPSGATLGSNVILTKANAKALGYTGLGSGSDGTIVFNSLFNFDYDNSNGIAGMDFESVALHEIGHTLGFFSGVDLLDVNGPSVVSVFPLDLYRFSDNDLPINVAEFTTTPRELRPGQKASTSDLENAWQMSTGRTHGDGRQASHWKDSVLTGISIGSMNPTIAFGQKFLLSSADLRAMDLIGWDVQTATAVPEPGTTSLLAAALAALFWLRQRYPQ